MKQKKIIDKNLYLEGMRQTRTLGILSLVIQVIICILIPIGNYLSEKEYRKTALAHMKNYNFTPTDVVVSYSHIFMLLTPLFAFFMVLSLFRFLKKREDCDFYHSIPQTRVCLFNSFSLAIVTWLIGTSLITSLVSTICYKLCDEYLTIIYSQIWGFSLNILILSLLISTVALLSCAMCGNTITTIFTFFILLLTPKILFMVYVELMQAALSYLTNSILKIFSPKYHLLFCMFMYMDCDLAEYGRCVLPTSSTLYTLVISVIVYMLALYVFKKRKSESAGNAMCSQKLQTAFRTLFTSLICLIPITIFFMLYISTQMGDDLDQVSVILFSVIVAYIVALIFMYIYEFTTTKNGKQALKAFYSIPLLIVINLVIFVFLISSYNHYKNIRLDPDDIDSVTFSLRTGYGDYDYYYDTDYFTEQLSSIDFTDPEIIELLCDAYNTYADKITTPYDEKEEVRDEDITQSYYNERHLVKFKGNGVHEFNVSINNTLLKALNEKFNSVPEIRDTYMTLPDKSKITYIDIYDSFADNTEVPKDVCLDIYNVLREELASGDIRFEDWYAVLKQNNYDNSTTITLDMEISEHGSFYGLNIPITSCTPKTLDYAIDKLLKICENDCDAYQEILDDLDDYQKLSRNDCWFHINTRGFYFEGNTLKETEYTLVYSNDINFTSTDNYNMIKSLTPYLKSTSEYNPETDIILLIYCNFEVYSQEIYSDYRQNTYTMCVTRKDLEENLDLPEGFLH